MAQPDTQTPTADQPLWTPSQERIEQSQMYDFMQKAAESAGEPLHDYQSLWQWSVDNPETFWDMVWDYCGVVGEKTGPVLINGDRMPGAQFYPEALINYAENLLKRKDDGLAIIFRDEKGKERQITYKELYEQTSLWQQAFIDAGIEQGDRIAAYMPNIPETIIAMLAATSLGAIWASASPDFGVQGVIDRFGQIEPKILVTVNGYYYNGKEIDCLDKLRDIQPRLHGLEKTIIVPFLDTEIDTNTLRYSFTQETFLEGHDPEHIEFNRVDFNHPLFIMFSSGTTGAPKCIVHGHGGTLLQHVKEQRLHCDLRADDKFFYFTTCGWMMWNWLVTGLASGTTLLLFDGSPFYPDGNALWDFTSAHDCKLFGTSAKYIDALKVNEIHPGKTHNLDALKLITSTGSPLVHESFDFVYEAIKKDVHLTPIYGGTDIIAASFGIGNPLSPVWRGEMQGPALATAIAIYDENGKPVGPGEGCGDLVLTKPIPSMPVSFWNDPDGKKYHSAYFEDYPNTWRHGDWAELTVHNGLIVHGRSDATLNPGGVRIGTAEIYRQVEQIPSIVESLAIGQDWDNDVRVVLFVVMKPGKDLTDELKQEIKTRIRTGASPRHMPAKIIAVADIPRTKSNKITELAVRDIIHGRPVKNIEALANPEALDLYKDLEDLKS